MSAKKDVVESLSGRDSADPELRRRPRDGAPEIAV